MKINKNKTVMIVAVVAAIIVLVIGASIVRAEPAPSMYFIPDGGSGTCGELETIDLMVNTTTSSMTAFAYVWFDPACINITDVDFTGSPWQPMGTTAGWSNQGDHIILSLTNDPAIDPGIYKIAALDIDCVGGNCTSDIGLTRAEPIGVVPYNTTFICSEITEVPTTISIGDCTGSITMPIQFTDAIDIGAVDATLTYDPNIVNVALSSNGNMDYTEMNMEVPGTVRIGGCQATSDGLDGSFDLASFSFSPVATVGSSTLTLTITTLKDATPTGNEVAYIVMNGVYMTLLNGDVNDDGVVNVADGVYIMKYCIGVNGYETIDEAAADVNGDTIIDMHDAVYIFKHLAGVTGFETLK